MSELSTREAPRDTIVLTGLLSNVPAKEHHAAAHRDQDQLNHEPDYEESGANNTKDATDVGQGLARRVHLTRAHLLQIVIAHDPRWDPSENSAANQTEDAQNKDQCPAMWPH